MTTRLDPVKSPEQWNAYHELRRVVLFENRGLYGVYNQNHPDERAQNNYPMLFYSENIAVGVIRIDLNPEQRSAIFRRLAIRDGQQRRGFGRSLMQHAEAFAVAHGCTSFVVNAALDAVGFYQKLGYQLDTTSPLNDQKSPRMVKRS